MMTLFRLASTFAINDYCFQSPSFAMCDIQVLQEFVRSIAFLCPNYPRCLKGKKVDSRKYYTSTENAYQSFRFREKKDLEGSLAPRENRDFQ